MEAVDGHSKACCNIPPIVAKEYEVKGKYEEIGGLKTYVTGPAGAKAAILIIYDIFGYFPQTLQGADILATSDKNHYYQVFMPDFFEGEPADIAWYPPVTDAQKKALGEWFPHRTPPTGVAKIPKIINDIQLKYGKKQWAAVGFCWGGKVVSLTSGPDTLFKVAAQSSPAMIDAEDATKISIPMCILASQDEAVSDVEGFEKALTGEKHVEIFKDQVHGFMTARADLEDEKVRKEYERGYATLLDFFAKHL
ncbi:Alpha/Beta hydrolase protein [Halenospora varia]|nr:Alpha/Beta hydrolase protein [Halenospora varia]